MSSLDRARSILSFLKSLLVMSKELMFSDSQYDKITFAQEFICWVLVFSTGCRVKNGGKSYSHVRQVVDMFV